MEDSNFMTKVLWSRSDRFREASQSFQEKNGITWNSKLSPFQKSLLKNYEKQAREHLSQAIDYYRGYLATKLYDFLLKVPPESKQTICKFLEDRVKGYEAKDLREDFAKLLNDFSEDSKNQADT